MIMRIKRTESWAETGLPLMMMKVTTVKHHRGVGVFREMNTSILFGSVQ
jgi:hypothetical protein